MRLHENTFIRFYNRLKPIYKPDCVAAIGYIDANGRKQIIADLTKEELREVLAKKKLLH